jgi:threonine/homoserine/homoserine lactone efflux protein
MFTLATLGAYIGIVFILFVIPGPAVLFIVTRTAQSGRKAGIMAGLGISTGDIVHTFCTTVGLSALLLTSAVAFNVVKVAGAFYLVYLGIRAILERRETNLNSLKPKLAPIGPLKSYRQGILVEVLNPKTALFFLAFLPQFVHPEQGSSFLQFFILGLVFVLLSAVYTTVTAISVGLFGRMFQRQTWIHRFGGKVVGVIYIGLGLKVALESR